MDLNEANEFTKRAWEANAAFWDERMGEGNDFVNLLCWPNLERLLSIQPGWQVLDIACGNGLISRRMAALGANVTAFDFSSELIKLARRRTPGSAHITYQVLDATDEQALKQLMSRAYDAAVCNMALFDIANIKPLFHVLSDIIKPGGAFVFSVIHPCFNSAPMAFAAETQDRDGIIVTTHYLKLFTYLTATTYQGLAIDGQPQAQLYFHRPLQELLTAGFETGFMLDALAEPGFPPSQPIGKRQLGWNGNFYEFPPVMVCRMLNKPSKDGARAERV